LNSHVAAFKVTSSTGALTAVTNSPFATSTTPVQVVVDASGKFVYASDFGSGVLGGVSEFTLGSSGALTPVSGSPFNTENGGPFGVATTGQFVYVTEKNASQVAALSITAGTGGLAPLAPEYYATGNQPTGVVVAVTQSGKYLYVANDGDSTISAYSVGSSGALTAIGSPLTTTQPYYLAVDPLGKFLYATNPLNGTITGYTINSTTGALTQFSGTATAAGTQPVSLTVVTVP